MSEVPRYTGRFAPSPTGPLHFGSLVTALASWCEARVHQGRWLVRIEDTDLPRNQPGAEAEILAQLETYGFIADEPISRQQDRIDLYNQILDDLAAQGDLYGCACSRKQLTGYAAYPNTCRGKKLSLTGNAVRLRVSDDILCFQDQLQGQVCENLSKSTGDFVLRRRDGIISYQLAVVVDDHLQGVTHIVRGADLLDNTVRQIWLRQCLRATTSEPIIEPIYTHIPLAMNAQGQKLSKQNRALPLDVKKPVENLQAAFVALGQDVIYASSPEHFLRQAITSWDINRIARQTQLDGQF
ncbi:tRNA glutamyl-Q(34) synthetase GluQRS [Aquirhabdus sp.]|uniref:tRNA glutamyl-Q(34) synthetase GluQRS n=1 Tax=Aquirhabdus sp. TaxID=2824160 RepID=UPI00396C3E10